MVDHLIVYLKPYFTNAICVDHSTRVELFVRYRNFFFLFHTNNCNEDDRLINQVLVLAEYDEGLYASTRNAFYSLRLYAYFCKQHYVNAVLDIYVCNLVAKYAAYLSRFLHGTNLTPNWGLDRYEDFNGFSAIKIEAY